MTPTECANIAKMTDTDIEWHYQFQRAAELVASIVGEAALMNQAIIRLTDERDDLRKCLDEAMVELAVRL